MVLRRHMHCSTHGLFCVVSFGCDLQIDCYDSFNGIFYGNFMGTMGIYDYDSQMNLYDLFNRIFQGSFFGTGAIYDMALQITLLCILILYFWYYISQIS